MQTGSYQVAGRSFMTVWHQVYSIMYAIFMDNIIIIIALPNCFARTQCISAVQYTDAVQYTEFNPFVFVLRKARSEAAGWRGRLQGHEQGREHAGRTADGPLFLPRGSGEILRDHNVPYYSIPYSPTPPFHAIPPIPHHAVSVSYTHLTLPTKA